ncbi:MAG: FlgD immunoglobulin-like domain containing protein [Candidatus Zixiibacteriota bacterium]
MRLVKIPLMCLLALLALADYSQAQPQFGCDDIVHSSFDVLRLPFFCGKPGDTVLLPVILDNDSIVTSFQFLIEFDTAWLRPVFIRDSSCAVADQTGCIQWNVDTTFVDHLITRRMLITDTTPGEFGPVIDTINQFSINLFQGRKNVLACNAVPEFLTLDSLPPGNDTIFYVKMAVKATTPHLQLARFTFFESDIFIVDDSVFPPDTTYFNGCNASQMVTAWYKGLNGQGEDSTENFQVYPTTDLGYTYWFQADTACVPPAIPDPTVAFSANPTSITTSQTSALTWTSTNTDSVVIRDGVGSRLAYPVNGQISGTINWSPPSTGTFSFTARAYGTNGNSAFGNATVTVTTGGTGQGPNMSVSGLASPYNQGELISFTVTATNTTGTQITIVASGLPANASFGNGGQVIGVSPLTGTFSWTPSNTQEGFFTVTFTGSHSGGSTVLPIQIEVKELEFDRLFSTSREGNRPVGGRPGRAGIAFPIDLVKRQPVYGIQFDMTYPDEFLRIDSIMTTIRIPEYVVYDNIGATPGTIRVVTFGLNNEEVIDTNTTAILHMMMTLDSSAVPWTDLVINLENGRESTDPDPLVGSKPLLTDSGLVVVDSLGDVNLDRFIDVADAVNIVAYIIGTFPLVERQFEVADIIENDSVNVFDLVADINMIYGIALPAPVPPPPDQIAVLSLAYNEMISGSNDLLVVRSQIPEEVAGVQLQLNYDPTAVSFGSPRLTADVSGYALHSNDNGQGRLKILLYKFAPYNSGDFMQPGDVDLVEIPITAYKDLKADDKTRIRLTEALLSNTVAGALAVQGVDTPLPNRFTLRQNYPNPFNPTTTIEFEIGVADLGALQQDVSLDVFNILGQHVTTLFDGRYAAGAYKVTWDATDHDGRRVASGVYLYRLKVGEEFMTKKMLFLK